MQQAGLEVVTQERQFTNLIQLTFGSHQEYLNQLHLMESQVFERHPCVVE